MLLQQFFLAFFGFSTFFVPNNVNAMHGYWCASSQSKSKKTLISLLVTFSPETCKGGLFLKKVVCSNGYCPFGGLGLAR